MNAIKQTVKKLAEQAGLKGKFTNHSLHATCAMRLFEAGVDEQLIKCVTGHRSEAVRDYKRESAQLISEAQKKVSCTVSKAEVSETPEYKEPPEFDIDKIPCSGEWIEYKVGDKHAACHKNPCLGGKCGPLCNVVKQIDELAKVKKLKLSLKYWKNKSK